MNTDGFPFELHEDVTQVLSQISKKTYCNILSGETDELCQYTLLSGEVISFPYRIYYLDKYENIEPALTSNQRKIYHALFTRSCDGYIREKHIRALLSDEYPDWVLPYILKVSSEYVVEILEIIYNSMLDKNTDSMKTFCSLNLQSFLNSHDRMISYWNEFYRNKCFHYKDYIGKKLFSECFGYTRSMEKVRSLKSYSDIT